MMMNLARARGPVNTGRRRCAALPPGTGLAPPHLNTGARTLLPPALRASLSEGDAAAPPEGGPDSPSLPINSQPYTMDQLFAKQGGSAFVPTPLAEHQRRSRARDMRELLESAARLGKPEQAVREGIDKLDALLPGVFNLHKMSASTWVGVACDVDGMMGTVIALRSAYPTADVLAMLRQRPALLVQSAERIADDAARVRRLLTRPGDAVDTADAAAERDAVVQAYPDLVCPDALSRSLAQLAQLFPDNVVDALLKNPALMSALESEPDVEDSAGARGSARIPHIVGGGARRGEEEAQSLRRLFLY